MPMQSIPVTSATRVIPKLPRRGSQRATVIDGATTRWVPCTCLLVDADSIDDRTLDRCVFPRLSLGELSPENRRCSASEEGGPILTCAAAMQCNAPKCHEMKKRGWRTFEDCR